MRRNPNRPDGASARPSLLTLLGLGVLLALAAALPAQAATPAQIELLSTDPAYSQVTVNLPGGGTSGLTAPGQFQLEVTPAGGTPVLRQGFCVDTLNPIGVGTPYSVSLQTAADDPSLGDPASGEAAWLIQEADNLIAASANPSLEAGAIQVAVWVILSEANPVTPTSDAVLNARALQIRALAAGRRPAGPVAISAAASSTCAGGTGTTLTVAGTPGASASLAVTQGQGALSQSQVTFGPAGTAAVTLTSAAAGTVQVTVTSNGSELTRATRLPGTGSEPQDTGFMVPRTYTASVSVGFTSCVAISQVTQPTQTKAPAPTLKVTKRAPKVLKSGSRVRYTIRVTNTSRRTVARNVVATDLMPRGMSYRSTSRRPHQLGNRISWRLGTLRPGQSRNVRVVLQAPVGLAGTRTNVVVVSATGARTVRARATTRFTQVRVQQRPPVTG